MHIHLSLYILAVTFPKSSLSSQPPLCQGEGLAYLLWGCPMVASPMCLLIHSLLQTHKNWTNWLLSWDQNLGPLPPSTPYLFSDLYTLNPFLGWELEMLPLDLPSTNMPHPQLWLQGLNL